MSFGGQDMAGNQPVTLTFSDGTNLEVLHFAWDGPAVLEDVVGGQINEGPQIRLFQFLVPVGTAGPGLLRAAVNDDLIGNLVMRFRNPQGIVLANWTLFDASIERYQFTDAGDVFSVSFGRLEVVVEPDSGNPLRFEGGQGGIPGPGTFGNEKVPPTGPFLLFPDGSAATLRRFTWENVAVKEVLPEDNRVRHLLSGPGQVRLVLDMNRALPELLHRLFDLDQLGPLMIRNPLDKHSEASYALMADRITNFAVSFSGDESPTLVVAFLIGEVSVTYKRFEK
jgi:hypothetical protein